MHLVPTRSKYFTPKQYIYEAFTMPKRGSFRIQTKMGNEPNRAIRQIYKCFLFYTGPVLTMNSFVEKEKEKENKIIGCSNQWTGKRKKKTMCKSSNYLCSSLWVNFKAPNSKKKMPWWWRIWSSISFISIVTASPVKKACLVNYDNWISTNHHHAYKQT